MEAKKSTIHLYPGSGEQVLVFSGVTDWEHSGGEYIRFKTEDGFEITSTLPWFVSCLL